MENPYQPPQSDVSLPDTRENSIEIFGQFSTWAVFGLSIITLGIYNIYWLYTRTRLLNKLKYVDPVSENFMKITTAIYVLSMPLGFIDGFLAQYPYILLLTKLVSATGTIMALVWVFMFRNQLNSFLYQSDKPTSKLGPVMTFLFQIIYLSYKVNENIELSKSGNLVQEQQM